MATLPVDRGRRGVGIDAPTDVPITRTEELPEKLVQRLEQRLGYPLPAAYRTFLAGTNGGTPAAPGVHPGFGFVVDQAPVWAIWYADDDYRDDDRFDAAHISAHLLGRCGADFDEFWGQLSRPPQGSDATGEGDGRARLGGERANEGHGRVAAAGQTTTRPWLTRSPQNGTVRGRTGR